MGLLADRRILITGVLSTRSIAYGVAKACQREGATLAFTYVNADLRTAWRRSPRNSARVR
jgi:enoyl-[acyl-carrier protein] reductase I